MLQDNPLWHRLTSRLHIIVALIGALILTAILAVAVGTGDGNQVAIIMATIVAVALVLMLGEKYWMLIPFAFSAQLPAFPIRGRLLELPEIVAVLCTLAFLVRFAVRRQKFTLFRVQHAPFLLYVGWVAFIFLLNPIGFSGLADSGAGLGGARFYAKILMALAAFLIMANQQVTEKDCKRIIVLLVIGSFLGSAYQIGLYFLPGSLGAYVDLTLDPDSFYTWHQSLAIVPLLLITLGFSRYRPSEMFSLNRLWAVFGFGLCVVLIAFSGKRQAIATVPMLAILAAFMRREWGFFMVWVGGAILAGCIIVAGHGELFRLPLIVQRALSVLPARWDAELGTAFAGGKDEFRAELRRQAIKKIELDSWIGEGYQIDLRVGQALSTQYATRGGDIELQCTPFALGSAWHNTWLGYAADFGIPASVIAALIFFSVIRASYRLTVHFRPGSLRATVVCYIFLTTTALLLRSHTSGHSSLDAFQTWWAYGLLVSLAVQMTKDQTVRELGQGGTSPSPSGIAVLMPLEAGQRSRPSPPAAVVR
jgi:branched-subunit amino acid transport protein